MGWKDNVLKDSAVARVCGGHIDNQLRELGAIIKTVNKSH